MAFDNIPITPAGVGGYSSPVRWSYTQQGQYLSVFGINNHISMTFNLKSAMDIDYKLKSLYAMRDRGLLNNDDIQELEERLRTYHDLEMGGNGPHSLAGIRESAKHKKGKKYVTYKDGIRKEIIARGPNEMSTQAQRDAAENARQYAHTEEANAKRRKSINAKREDKIIDEG